MHITITGASGFVGTNLSLYLKAHNFTVNSLSLRGNWSVDFNFKTDAVIHLAGKAHDLENTTEDLEYFKVNRDLTIELFQQFLKSEARDFFYFSSVKAVADIADEVIEENIVPNPLTPYGKSKFEAEQFLLSQIIPNTKRLFIIRPCMIHGPGNKGNLNLLYKVVENRIPWPLVNFENRRSFLSIDNLSFLIYKMLLNKEISSGIYNFADDLPLSTNDLIRVITSTLSRKPRFLPLPKGLVKSIARFGDFCPFPLNSERLKKLTENYVVSNSKIKKALKIENLPVSADKGISITAISFRK